MLAYLDTSALVKLMVAEPASTALRRSLDGVELVASALVRTELRRAVARYGQPKVDQRVAPLLATLALVRVDDDLLDKAGRLSPASLRSLDAIHLSTALSLGHRLDRLITYDTRMAEAARGHGIAVDAPGQSET